MKLKQYGWKKGPVLTRNENLWFWVFRHGQLIAKVQQTDGLKVWEMSASYVNHEWNHEPTIDEIKQKLQGK